MLFLRCRLTSKQILQVSVSLTDTGQWGAANDFRMSDGLQALCMCTCTVACGRLQSLRTDLNMAFQSAHVCPSVRRGIRGEVASAMM